MPLLAGDHAAGLADGVGAPTPSSSADGDGLRIEHRTAAAGRELHPDLALLLSTSGSTGSPKLVRLSARQPRRATPGRSPSTSP